MPLLLLTPREDIEATHSLADAARALGWEVARSTNYQPTREQFPQEIVLYGETLFTTLAAKSLCVFVLEPPFDLLMNFPPDYLKREVKQQTLGDARSISTPFFAKSADGNKAVDSQVYRSGAELPSRFIPKELLLFISEPVRWSCEYRFFILERQIVTLSIYARDGEFAVDDDGHWDIREGEQQAAVDFCNSILTDARFELPPVVVLDIGEIAGRGWALIEPNPVSSSGIYGCDVAQVLLALRRACVPQAAILEADKRWIVERPI